MTIKFNMVLVDDRNVATIIFFFKKYCSDRCRVVAEKMADAFIINSDHPRAVTEYKRIKDTFPEKAIISMALHRPLDLEQDYYLEKPIIASQFLNIVDELEKKILFRKISQRDVVYDTVNEGAENKTSIRHPSGGHDNKIVSAQAAHLLTLKNQALRSDKLIKINIPEKSTNARGKTFKLEEYILGAIYRAYTTAIESKSVVKLSGLWRPIYFFPDTNEVYVDLSYSQLRSVCATSINNQSDTLVPREIKIEKSRREWELKHCLKLERFRPIENFMWKIALYSARGRIPDFIDTKKIIHLNSWPNLTRLDLTPDIIKLIAFWSCSKHSLDDAVTQLKVKQQDAYALFTALYILGHVSYSDKMKSHNVTRKEAEQLSSDTKNVLSKLITKLKLAW